MMKYKGYLGQVEFVDKAKIFHGEVIGLKDAITFQGTDVHDLKKAFHHSVDEYLVWCKERGEKPEKSFSGNVRVQMAPDLHAHLAFEAAKYGISLNELINKKLTK